MLDHGGGWTEDKLGRLKAYLTEYRTIFDKNPKARYYTTWYVDAFAGTGSRVDDTEEVEQYRAGSAQIALSLESPFHRYLFIEKQKARCEELERLIAEKFPHLRERCEIVPGDANDVLCSWIRRRDWSKDRAVVFLDPYGLQVEWRTVQALGATKGVDLWYLFPLSVIRLLRRDGQIDPAWRAKLTSLFGTPDWEQQFYSQETMRTLFEEAEILVRDVSVKKVQGFIDQRLKTAFFATAEALVLRNSNQSPLFSLCFAAANPKGAPIAIRIANSILSKD